MPILTRLTVLACSFGVLGTLAWSNADVQDLVKWHNIFRCMHGVPPVQWSGAIAANADKWAAETKGDMVHSSQSYRENVGGFTYLGENLYKAMPASAATGKDAVKAWYSEVKDSDGGRCTDFDPKTGHYSQVVWKESTTIGCSFYDGLVDCQYGPGGNMVGDFTENVNAPVKSMVECGGPEEPLPVTNSHEVGEALEEDCLEVLKSDSAFENSYSTYCGWALSDYGHKAVAMPSDCSSVQVAAGPHAQRDALKRCGSECEIVDEEGRSCGNKAGAPARECLNVLKSERAFEDSYATYCSWDLRDFGHKAVAMTSDCNSISVAAGPDAKRDALKQCGSECKVVDEDGKTCGKAEALARERPAERPVLGSTAFFVGLASGVAAFFTVMMVVNSVRRPYVTQEPLIATPGC